LAPHFGQRRNSRLKNDVNPFSAFCGNPVSINFSAFKFTDGFSTGPLTLKGTTMRPCLSLKNVETLPCPARAEVCGESAVLLLRRGGADGEFQGRLVEGHGPGAIGFYLRIDQVEPAELRVSAAENEIGFHGFKRCRFTLLSFCKPDNPSSPLNFFNQVDIGEF